MFSPRAISASVAATLTVAALAAALPAAAIATSSCEVRVNNVVVLTVQAIDREACYRQTSFGSENCAHYAPYFKPGDNFLEQVFAGNDRVNSEHCQGPPAGSWSFYPLPAENLQTYRTRMDAYFAPEIEERGLEAVVQEEGSPYNEYVKYLRHWEPRLHPHGDFTAYFQLEQNHYGRRRGPAASAAAQGAATLAVGQPGDWQELGPIHRPSTNVGAEGTGPTEFITFFNPAPSRMLSGSAAGGLFYSSNGGVTWRKAGTDTLIGRSGVSTALFHPTDYRTWFAASSGNSGSSLPEFLGLTGGVFRTTDAGGTWSQVATSAQLGGIWSKVYKLAINSANANQLWAATSTGLYVTINALAAAPTWTAVADLAGKFVYDFEVRPGDAQWLYAAAANAGGTSWHFMVSGDNGRTWSPVPGEPASTAGAATLTIEVTPARATNLYCLIVAAGGGYPSELHVYDFASTGWTLVQGAARITMGGGHGFGVDPVDPNEIFLSEGTEGRRYNVGGTPPFVDYHSSYYGGGTYHPDIEDLVPHPVNTKEVWMSHHGGVSVSTDNGLTWTDRSTGLGVAQVWSMATAASDPGTVALGLYHDGTVLTTSPWYELWSPEWAQLPGSFCDGQRPLIDSTTPRYIWHSCQWGAWQHSSDFGASFAYDPPDSPVWIVEGRLNRLAPQIQYRLGQVGNLRTVERTLNRGTSWSRIADFSAIYPATLYEYWLVRLFVPETNGASLVVHLMERPAGSTIWWRSHLFRTKDANLPNATQVSASWVELPAPRDAWFTAVAFDPVNPDIVYVASGSAAAPTNTAGAGMVYRMDYTNPGAHTYGACAPGICRDLTLNLPNAKAGVDNLEVELGGNGGLYYVSDYGVWYSNDATRVFGGTGWRPFGNGLPNTTFNGLEINYVNDKVRVGSFGRGAWEADLRSGCMAPPSQLALWLPLDESTGPRALNTVPTSQQYWGTHAGAPTPSATGKVAGALCFDGSDDRVDVPAYGAISFATGNFSLAAWVRRSSSFTGVEVLVDKRRNEAPGVRGYSLFLFDGRPGLQLADSTFSNYVSATKLPDDRDWHHVAVTVDRSSTLGGRFYVDGRPAGIFDPTGHPGSLNTPAPLRVGARSAFGGPASVSGVLTGCLDEVTAFRRVLSSDEVLSIYRVGANGQCKQSCTAPSVTFCGPTATLTVDAQLCNQQAVSRKFDYRFLPLPVQNGCSLPGPTAIAPAAGKVTVPAGSCATVRPTIGRPAALSAGKSTCYQLVVQPPATEEPFACGGVIAAEHVCSDPQ